MNESTKPDDHEPIYVPLRLEDLPTIDEEIKRHSPVDAGRLAEEAARLHRGEAPLTKLMRRESDGQDWHGERHGVD